MQINIGKDEAGIVFRDEPLGISITLYMPELELTDKMTQSALMAGSIAMLIESGNEDMKRLVYDVVNHMVKQDKEVMH